MRRYSRTDTNRYAAIPQPIRTPWLLSVSSGRWERRNTTCPGRDRVTTDIRRRSGASARNDAGTSSTVVGGANCNVNDNGGRTPPRPDAHRRPRRASLDRAPARRADRYRAPMTRTQLTAEAVVDGRVPRASALSPDGRWVAYVVARSDRPAITRSARPGSPPPTEPGSRDGSPRVPRTMPRRGGRRIRCKPTSSPTAPGAARRSCTGPGRRTASPRRSRRGPAGCPGTSHRPIPAWSS